MASKAWDARQGKKLVVLAEEAEIETTSSHGGEMTRNPFVLLSLEGVKSKQQQRTRVIKRTVQPRWRDVFLFEIPREAPNETKKSAGRLYDPVLVAQVMDNSLRDRKIGTVQVALGDVMEDVMTEVYKDIVKEDKSRDRQPGQDDKRSVVVVGRLRLYLILTGQPNVPAAPPPAPVIRTLLEFPYNPDMTQFCPGDIILYSTAGPFSALARVLSGAQWSHCGIVVSVPNKWTLEPELCVVEFGANRENFIDLYNERPIHCGPMVFRLAERIHGFHGTEAWLLPLKERLSDEAAHNLSDWALSLVSEFYTNITCKLKEDRPVPIPFPQYSFSPSQITFLELLCISHRQANQYCDYYSAHMASRGLAFVGLEIPHDDVIVTLKDITASPFFAKPFLIRCRKQFLSNLYWPEDVPAEQQRQYQTQTRNRFQARPKCSWNTLRSSAVASAETVTAVTKISAAAAAAAAGTPAPTSPTATRKPAVPSGAPPPPPVYVPSAPPMRTPAPSAATAERRKMLERHASFMLYDSMPAPGTTAYGSSASSTGSGGSASSSGSSMYPDISDTESLRVGYRGPQGQQAAGGVSSSYTSEYADAIHPYGY